MPQTITNWEVNIDSGNGLVLSGNKPLPAELLLTQIHDAIWRHYSRPEWVNEIFKQDIEE